MGERSWMDEIEARRYELPRELGEREELRWRQVLRRGRARLVLKGAPGSGKTFMTRQAVAELARTERARLAERLAGTEAVTVPMWVTAKALAQAGAVEIEDALPEAIESSLGLSLLPNGRGWMRRAVSSSRVLVVVDALDELTGDDREKFAAKAKRLDDPKKDWRVLVTCRTMHWEERRSWLPWGRVEEVELSPFKRRQQREFTRKFFGPGSRLARSMESLLRVNYSLRHACATPLMLTFACVLHEEGAVNEGTSYAALYGRMLRKMFSGEWRGVRPPWTGSEVRTERHMHDVEGIAWGIFSRAPQQNLFKLADWGQSSAGAGVTASVDPADLLEQLQQVGLIVPGGFDEKNDRCWSFVHRTFLEFLAARALSRKGTQEWVGEARRHFWFEPEWLEVLTFLAGLVKDATPLIEAVKEEQEGDDLFSSMLYLKARLVGAAKTVDERVARQVADEVFLRWRETLDLQQSYFRKFRSPMLSALAMRGNLTKPLAEGMIELTKVADWGASHAAIEALGSIGGEESVGRLLELMNDAKLARYTVMVAAEALGSIVSEESVEWLLELTKDQGRSVSMAAAATLGWIGAERSVERLLELTRDRDSHMRRTAVEALGRIGAERSVGRLLELMKDIDSSVRRAVAKALGDIDDERTPGRLLELTKDADSSVRELAVETLGSIGAEEAAERLLELTEDKDPYVRRTAAWTLGRIGAVQAVGRLLELTTDENRHVRPAARGAVAEVIGRIGTEKAIERLLELTRLELTEGENRYMRVEAVRVLGKIGAEQSVERLLELTKSASGFMREEVAGALGRSGAEQAVGRLLEMTKHKTVPVPRSAARALGSIGPEQAIERLLEMTKDKDSSVRGAAVEALWHIAWKNKIKVSAPRDEE